MVTDIKRSSLARSSWRWLPLPAIALIAWKYRHGSDAIVEQHDVLDFSAGVLNRLTLSDLFSSPGAKVPYLLGGLERGFVGSEFHLGHLTFALLPLLWAFIVNEIAMRTLAHSGMYLLLGRLGLKNDRPTRWAGAVIFSLMPFYSMGFGASAGIPLLLWAFVTVIQERTVRRATLSVFVLLPFYVAAYASIPYWLALAFAGLTVGAVHNRDVIRPLSKALLALGIAIVVVDWRLFVVTASGPTSHRVEMIADRSLTTVFNDVGLGILKDSQHAYAGRSLSIGLALVIGLAVFLLRPNLVTRQLRHGATLLCGLFLVGIVGSRIWPWFESVIVADVLHEWGRFQMSRLRWMEPAIVTALAAISIGSARAATHLASGPVRTATAVVAVMVGLSQANVVINAHQFRNAPESLTLARYYAAETMGDIRSAFEDDNGNRAVSVRLHPSVAIQNGIPSADGYWTSYNIEYKARFRALIAPTLEAHDRDRAYFDNWGSRAYLFLGDQGRTRCCDEPIHNSVELAIDPEAMYDLGITHVISGSQITNASSIGLELINDFGRADELGQVLLYRRVN